MKIAVLGAGVIGLTTAHCLARDGHAVEVIERNAGVGLETSFGNGAQLAYSYVAPMAGPGVLPKVPLWLLREDSALRFKPAFDLRQWRWLIDFALACNQATSQASMRHQIALSFYSRTLMHALLAEEKLEFGYERSGKLVAFSDQAGFDDACRLLDYQRSLGCEQEALDRAACQRLEPALGDPASSLGRRLVGGIHTPSEEVGDCYRFCVALEARLRSMGVQFRLGTRITALRGSSGHITGASTDQGEIQADRYVLTLGAQSPFLVRPLGIRLPIYPLKGYSLSLAAAAAAPRISITDFQQKVVYAPLNDQGCARLRVAGMADIAGYSTKPDMRRLSLLLKQAEGAFPAATDYSAGLDAMQPWTGLRPATPKSTPIIGPTSYSNLFLNCGHGGLGWTLAMGSARLVADLIAGIAPVVPHQGFALAAH